MAEFITGQKLVASIEKIIDEAQEEITLVSPYIKLNPHLARKLRSKLENNPKIQLVILFGKSENQLNKSISKETFDLIKSLPNVLVKHEPDLHAKYYANEFRGLLSSMNLYEYSINTNIEFGIEVNWELFGGTSSKIEKAAKEFFVGVIQQSEVVYDRVPQMEKGFFKRNYAGSEVEVDELSKYFDGAKGFAANQKSSYPKPNGQTGYCIRTGVEIPFNPKRPLSDKAYSSWLKFGDESYREKYCHYSGEPSNGETSFARPILKKNWRKAMS